MSTTLNTDPTANPTQPTEQPAVVAAPQTLEEKVKAMTNEQKQANLNALTYIKTLAANSSVDISEWNILEVFSQEDGLSLVADKKKLNKLFFSHLEEISNPLRVAAKKIVEQPKAEEAKPVEAKTEAKEETKEEKKKPIKKIEEPDPPVDIAQEMGKIKDVFEKQYQIQKQKELQNYKQQYTTYANTVADYSRRMDDAQKVALSYALKIRDIENRTQDPNLVEKFGKQLQKVIDDGFWTNPVIENNFLYLNTPINVMLHEVNKEANLDLHVDFGKLAVRIDIANSFTMTVIPYKNNITTSNVGYVKEGYYHPHVQNNGAICWGEAQATAFKNIADFEFDKALRLLHALLNSYNPGSPYVTLANFKMHSEKMSRTPDHLMHPDKRRKPKEEKKDNNVGTVLGGGIAPAAQPARDNGY